MYSRCFNDGISLVKRTMDRIRVDSQVFELRKNTRNLDPTAKMQTFLCLLSYETPTIPNSPGKSAETNITASNNPAF